MNPLAEVVALLCLTVLPTAAQTKVLVAKNRIPTNVAFDEPRSYALPTLCDQQGRIYVKLVKSGMVGPLLRLSSKGLLEAEFDTTGELVNIYAARRNGGVAMVRTDPHTKFVDNFGPDGTRESSVPLERPPVPFFPMQIAVFPSGEILVAGLQYHPGYKASTAVYDPAGHLVKQFTLDGDAEREHAIATGDPKDSRGSRASNEAVSRSVAITGDDGLVYLMRATSPATVYAISAGGEVVRTIVVSAPFDAAFPSFGLRAVKNKLAVSFYRHCDDTFGGGCRGKAYTVVDATTGKKLADYETEEETNGPIACYAPDPDRFFAFSIAADKHHLEIVEAGPR